MSRGPVPLATLDGFGIGDGGAVDATALAHAPFLERPELPVPGGVTGKSLIVRP